MIEYGTVEPDLIAMEMLEFSGFVILPSIFV